METRLFYMVEDDYNISSLYPTKEKWLESLKYQLEVEVDYEDIYQEESEIKLNDAINLKSNEVITSNTPNEPEIVLIAPKSNWGFIWGSVM